MLTWLPRPYVLTPELAIFLTLAIGFAMAQGHVENTWRNCATNPRPSHTD